MATSRISSLLSPVPAGQCADVSRLGSTPRVRLRCAVKSRRTSVTCATQQQSFNNDNERKSETQINDTLLPLVRQFYTQVRKVTVASLVALQVVAPIPLELPEILEALANGGAAHAVLLSPDTKVPKNAEVALRRAVPVVNSDLRQMQDGLEEIFVLLRIPQRKPYGSMETAVKKALATGEGAQDKLIRSVPEERQAEAKELLEGVLKNQKGGLPGLLAAVQAKDADAVSIRLASTLDKIAQLAVLQAPGLQFLVPAQYSSYPRLTGRAVVEFTVLKKDGSSFVVKNGAETVSTGRLLAVLDGYSAPLTSGNFAKLVLEREYDGVGVKSTQQAVLGDARDASSLSLSSLDFPLEIMPSGEFQPLYKTALEVADGELPVLPMSVFGALVMSHGTDSDTSNSPSQFFFYLYDKRNSGLGGLAFEEGQFSVFGYVTEGKDVLSQLRTGDVIQSARIVSGADRLVVPSQ